MPVAHGCPVWRLFSPEGLFQACFRPKQLIVIQSDSVQYCTWRNHWSVIPCQQQGRPRPPLGEELGQAAAAASVVVMPHNIHTMIVWGSLLGSTSGVTVSVCCCRQWSTNGFASTSAAALLGQHACAIGFCYREMMGGALRIQWHAVGAFGWTLCVDSLQHASLRLRGLSVILAAVKLLHEFL